MPTPQRTLSGVCEISTGAFTVEEMPPAYTGEVAALKVDVQFTQDGQPCSADGSTVEMYLYYETRHLMTQAVNMAVSGNRASGTLGVDDFALDGAPLLVIRMTDTQTGEIIVACTVALVIQDVLGVAVISVRPATPSEVVYVGRAPYIDDTTHHWFIWDNETAQYVDSGVNAYGGETLEQIMNAEKGRVEAENQRVTNEEARADAETLRAQAETARGNAENARAAAEKTRDTAENARNAAEEQRVLSEADRESAEGLRESAEQDRDAAEQERAEAEQGRITNENARKTAEQTRADAEQGRADAEAARASAESARAAAEKQRVTDEAARKTAENGRVTAEKDRVTAENERVQQAKENKAIVDKYSEFAVDMEILPPSADGYARVEQSEKKTELFLGVPVSNFAYATFWIDLVTRQLMMRVPNGFSAITFAIKNREMVVRING